MCRARCRRRAAKPSSNRHTTDSSSSSRRAQKADFPTTNASRNTDSGSIQPREEEEKKRCVGGKSNRDDDASYAPNTNDNHYSLAVPRIYARRIRDTSVLVWGMPPDLSQSRLAGRSEPSSACTLIALKVAEYMYRNRLLFPTISEEAVTQAPEFHFRKNYAPFVRSEELVCPPAIVNALLNAILDGNRIYETAIKIFSGNGHTFSVPEALKATNEQFHEIQYCSMLGPIDRNMSVFLRSALESPIVHEFKQLFFLLLVFERTILLVVQRHNNLIAAIDSHLHLQLGSMILCGRLEELDVFAKAICNYLFPESNCLPYVLQSFELSLIQFKGQLSPSEVPLDAPREPIRIRSTRDRIFSAISPIHRIDHSNARQAIMALRRNNIEELFRLVEKVQKLIKAGASSISSPK